MHAVLGSLAINNPIASHRIAGRSQVYGNGILCYTTRELVSEKLACIRENDPQAVVRVEPHNECLMGKALRSTDVEWIVNNRGELGVKIGDQLFFMYKGESLMYDGAGETDASYYRPVEKREFGESGPINKDVHFEDLSTWRPMDSSYANANNEVAYHNSDK